MLESAQGSACVRPLLNRRDKLTEEEFAQFDIGCGDFHVESWLAAYQNVPTVPAAIVIAGWCLLGFGAGNVGLDAARYCFGITRAGKGEIRPVVVALGRAQPP